VSFTLVSSLLACLLASNARAAEEDEPAPSAEPSEPDAAPAKKSPKPAPAEPAPEQAPAKQQPTPAGIHIADYQGWSLTIDGRINAFFVYGWGNHNAAQTPETGADITPGIGTGIAADNQIDIHGNFHTPRVRSGFVPNVLGFNLTKKVSNDTTLTGRIALWSDVHSNVSIYINAQTYVQEGYMKLEGPWGSLTAGRQLALFDRGSIEIDFNYGHNYGVGWPCNFNGVLPACGQIGFGALFPFFRAGLVYGTPSLGGFQFTAGVFDPTILAGKWERLIMPTLQAEAAYTLNFSSGMFKVFGSTVWQKIGGAANFVDPTPSNPNPPADDLTVANKTVDQYGFAAGFRLEVGPLRLGAAAHYGPGLGFFYAQENSQAGYYFAADARDPHDGDLRTFRGFYGQLALVFGPVMLAAGAGASQLVLLPFDDTAITPLPKQNLGVNGVFNYHIYDNFIWDLDAFRAESSWYGTAFKQTVYVVSSGFTMTF
jgi:hypothetical protein